MPDQPEYRLCCKLWDLIQWAKKPGLHAFHVPNGGKRSAVSGAKLTRIGQTAGEPDYVLLYAGKAYGMEVKAEGGTSSEEQEAIRAAWKAAGHEYRVCTGYVEAVAFLEEIGCIRPVVESKRFAPRAAAA